MKKKFNPNALMLWRRESGLTQKDVARLIGVSASAICRIERGQTHQLALATITYQKLMEDCINGKKQL